MGFFVSEINVLIGSTAIGIVTWERTSPVSSSTKKSTLRLPDYVTIAGNPVYLQLQPGTYQITLVNSGNILWLVTVVVPSTASILTQLVAVPDVDLDALLPGLPPYSNLPNVQTLKVAFSYGDANPKFIHTIRPAETLFASAIVIETPFNGETPALRLGDTEQIDRLIRSNQVNAVEPGTYQTNPGLTLTQSTNINLTILPGTGCTEGSGFVLLTNGGI
jgi:hypothetical protein